MVIIYLTGLSLTHIAVTYGHNEKKVVEVVNMTGENYTALFMGNSLTNKSIMPSIIDRVTDTKSYNMALGGANILSMELVLRQYLKQNKTPKYVIYGLSLSHAENQKGIRSSLLYEVDEDIKKDYTFPNNKLLMYSKLPLFRYRKSLKELLKIVLNNQNASLEMKDGFVKSYKTLKNQPNLPPHNAFVNIEDLISFANTCKNHGIKLILFEPCLSKVYNEKTMNRQEMVEKVKGTSFDYEDYIQMNIDTDFLDETEDFGTLNHMNIYGARKFSEKLALELKQRNLITVSN